MVDTRPIRVGILGLGRSGWNMHADALSKLPEHYRVTAVFDPNRERRAEAETRFGCRSFDELDALLKEDLELVVVASPSHLHTEHVVKAFEAGHHVLAEKPLAGTLEEVDTMIAAGRHAGKLFSVNQNYRYKDDFRKVSEVMASGKLGEIVQIRMSIHQFSRRWDWQTLRRFNGGILNNHGAHVLDWMLTHFTDDEPELFCQLLCTPLYAGDADSHAKVVLKPKDGPIMDAELTHCNAYPQNTWLVMGTQGSLTGTSRELRWTYFDPDTLPPLELSTEPTPDRSYNRESLPLIEETLVLEPIPNGDLVLLYRDLFTSIREGTPLAITAESVRRQIALLERCRKVAHATEVPPAR